DGQPLRIGGSTPLPITEPSEIPGFGETPDPLAAQGSVADPAPPLAIPQPQPVAEQPQPVAPAPPPAPNASTPPRPALDPNAIDLGASAPPLVTPEQLAPPPLVLDEAPAAATPSGQMPKPDARAASAPPSAGTTPSGPLQRPSRAISRPSPSGSMQRP